MSNSCVVRNIKIERQKREENEHQVRVRIMKGEGRLKRRKMLIFQDLNLQLGKNCLALYRSKPLEP
jgi:hypothetical protein